MNYIVLYTGQNAVGLFQKLGFADKSDLDQSLVTPRVRSGGTPAGYQESDSFEVRSVETEGDLRDENKYNTMHLWGATI